MAAEHDSATGEELELVMERTFEAPQKLVFSMFTEPHHMINWWGPTGWNTTIYEMDVVPGGVWHYCMRSSDGQEEWGKSVYQEIEPPRRLAYIDNSSDEQGNTTDDTPTMLVTMDFSDEGNRTTFVIRAKFDSQEELQKALDMQIVEVTAKTLDRLDGYLEEVQK